MGFRLHQLSTKIYAQMVQGLADYAQKFMFYVSLVAPDPLLTL